MDPSPAAAPSAIPCRFGVVRRRRASALSTVAMLGFSGAVLAGGLVQLASDRIDVVSTYILGIGALSATALLAGVASFATTLIDPKKSSSVVVHEGRLVVRGPDGKERATVAEGDVSSAFSFVRPARRRMPAEPSVEIELRSGDTVQMSLPTLAAADDVVAALGFGPAGARVTVRLAAEVRRLLHLLLAYGAYQLVSMVSSIFVAAWSAEGAMLDSHAVAMCLHALVVPALYLVAKRLLAPAVVTVGRDGVVVRRRGRTQLVPRARVTGVQQIHPVAPLEIHVEGAPAIVLDGMGIDAPKRAGLARVLHARLAPGGETPVATTFESGGRPVAAWRDELARAMNESTYRVVGATPDDAGRVLESPAATAEQRIGAALALRIAGEAPARIRVAADAVADDALRAALVAVADDDAHAEPAIARVLKQH